MGAPWWSLFWSNNKLGLSRDDRNFVERSSCWDDSRKTLNDGGYQAHNAWASCLKDQLTWFKCTGRREHRAPQKHRHTARCAHPHTLTEPLLWWKNRVNSRDNGCLGVEPSPWDVRKITPLFSWQDKERAEVPWVFQRCCSESAQGHFRELCVHVEGVMYFTRLTNPTEQCIWPHNLSFDGEELLSACTEQKVLVSPSGLEKGMCAQKACPFFTALFPPPTNLALSPQLPQ